MFLERRIPYILYILYSYQLKVNLLGIPVLHSKVVPVDLKIDDVLK